MRAEEAAFVGALVHRFPMLLPTLQQHLDDYDGLLPHVFLGDITRWIVEKFDSEDDSQIKGLLIFIEDCFSEGNENERELITVSFLENLPLLGKGAKLRTRLGPNLLQQLNQLHS